MGAAQTVLQVMPAGRSWVIKRDGMTLATFDSKACAVERAMDRARHRRSGSHIVIFNAKGQIEHEQTFPDATVPSPGGS